MTWKSLRLISAMSVPTLWLVLMADVTTTQGNVLWPGMELSGENVTVNVYRTESRVEGDYTFRARPVPPELLAQFNRGVHRNDGLGSDADRWRQFPKRGVDYHARVTFPVILATNGVPQENWIGVAKPTGTVDGREAFFRVDTFIANWAGVWWATSSVL